MHTCYGLDVIKNKKANNFWLVLNEKAFDLQSNYSDYFKKEENYTLNRILKNGCDITSIDIHYDNGTHDEIYVSWGGDSDHQNEYQKVELVEDKISKTNGKLLTIDISES